MLNHVFALQISGTRLLRPLPGPLQTEPETETEQGEEGRRRPQKGQQREDRPLRKALIAPIN